MVRLLPKLKKPDEITIYISPEGEVRWTRRNQGNHKVVGASTQGYNRYKDAMKNIKQTQKEPYTLKDTTKIKTP